MFPPRLCIGHGTGVNGPDHPTNDVGLDMAVIQTTQPTGFTPQKFAKAFGYNPITVLRHLRKHPHLFVRIPCATGSYGWQAIIVDEVALLSIMAGLRKRSPNKPKALPATGRTSPVVGEACDGDR